MGNIIKQIFSKKIIKKKMKILMLGLDGAGKTTILYSLHLGQVTNTIPTIGFNVQQLDYKTVKFMVWDVGGQQKLRNLWSHYYEKAQGLIYVIDSSDNERIDLAASELNRVIQHQDMKNCVVLILANKRDIATFNLQQLNHKLGTNNLKRNWAIFPVTAIKGVEESGIAQAMEWLIDNIENVECPKVTLNIG